MAFKSHGRGTAILRMSFRGIGRIERSIGFRDAGMLPRLKEMLRTLYETGRDDILQAIKLGPERGGLTLRQVWVVYRSGDWRKLPTPAHGLPYRQTFERWAEAKPQRSYQKFCDRVQAALEKVGEPLTLADLPDAARRYRALCESENKAAMWNRTHGKLRAFLRDLVGRDHQLYLDVAKLGRLREQQKRAVNAQTPQEAATIRELLGGEAGRIWWWLCCHGAMPDEFFNEKYRIEDGHLRILGTKATSRNRLVPLLGDPFRPVLSQRGFEKLMYRAKLGVMPYDARRSYGLWCDLCRLPEAWKAVLLGHSLTTTQGYGWRDAEDMLVAAEDKLRALIAPYDRGTGVGTGV